MTDDFEKHTITWLRTRRRSADPTAQRRKIARNRVLHDLPARGLTQRQSGAGHLLRAGLSVALAMALAFVAVLGASASALPGEALFAIKVGVEDFRLALASDEVGRSELLAGLIEVRLEELDRLASARNESGLIVSAGRLERQLILAEAGAQTPALELAIAHSQLALQALKTDLPDAALPGLQRALDAAGAPLEATATAAAIATATTAPVLESTHSSNVVAQDEGDADDSSISIVEPTVLASSEQPTQPGNSGSAGGPGITPPGQGGSIPGQGNPANGQTPATPNSGNNANGGGNGVGNGNDSSSAGGQPPENANQGGNSAENAPEDPGKGKNDKDK